MADMTGSGNGSGTVPPVTQPQPAKTGLGNLSFGRLFGGLVIVGFGVDLLANYDPKAAMIFAAIVLVSIVVVNPYTLTQLVNATNGLRQMLLGG